MENQESMPTAPAAEAEVAAEPPRPTPRRRTRRAVPAAETPEAGAGVAPEGPTMTDPVGEGRAATSPELVRPDGEDRRGPATREARENGQAPAVERADPGAAPAPAVVSGMAAEATAAAVEAEPAGAEAERTSSRRRRGRRGRRGDGREDGAPAAEGEPPTELSTGADERAGPGEPARPAGETPDEEAPFPRAGRETPEAAAPTDGREFRQPAPYERGGRQDGRGRRDWREASEARDYREAPRHVARDRPPQRERGYQGGRDGRQNGMAGREQVRDSQNYREPGGYREAAGYREPSGYREPGGYRETGNSREAAGYREPAGYREAPYKEGPRERGGYVEPAAGGAAEPARPARPAEVVTRGYVVAVDPNQNQWQLRTHGHLPSPSDATIALPVVRANGLRVGDEVVGLVRAASPGRRYGELLDVQSINGVPIEQVGTRPRFDDLTPIYPDRHMRLERPDSATAKLMDLVAPVGFGQRALIVSPPKAGKTTILKEIGRSVNINYPDVKLIVCLVGERPEEVTDLNKSLNGEVISSTFDEAIAHHTELAEITIERARRLVESGFDVVVLLDSVTRLARAYNLSAPGDSRSLSGGMATSALYPPKRFFGAARALQEGGSLTVIATCLVDTNSRLDDVIYEELKGTGNMELVLDRRLAEERIFPAVDIVKSSTRREELLLQPNELMAVLRLRRALSMASDPVNSTRSIIQQLERTKTNADFLASLLAQTSGR